MRRLLALIVLSTALLPTLLAAPKVVPPAPIVKTVTADDTCLAWVIDNEARGEPIKGQRAVYDVVKHRMEMRSLTACEVVKERNQFSGFHRGMRLTATAEMLHRLDKVRRIAPVVSNATYFHSKDVKPTWASKMKRILTIGKHVFLKGGYDKDKRNRRRQGP